MHHNIVKLTCIHSLKLNVLQNLFREFGEILEKKVVRDRFTKRSVGYGFINYKNRASALLAIEGRNGYRCNQHKILKVSFARRQCDDILNCKLHICNIPQHITKEQCHALFEQVNMDSLSKIIVL